MVNGLRQKCCLRCWNNGKKAGIHMEYQLFCLDCDDTAVKFSQGEAFNILMKSLAVIMENAEGDRFAKLQTIDPVTPIMNPGSIPPKRNIIGKFVQFSSNRKRRPFVGCKGQPVAACLHWIWNHE